MNLMSQCRIRWLVIFLPMLVSANASQTFGDEPASQGTDNTSITYWIEQLDSDQFLRRQTASKRLLGFGNDAVDNLADVTTRGQLELTERAISILQALALKQSPDDETGAWAALDLLVKQGGGSAALRASAAIELISLEREKQSQELLAAAGVKIGYAEFAISSSQINDQIVYFDADWNGDVETLRWLRWIKGVKYALLHGDSVNASVMEYVVRMPDLRIVVVRDATLDSDIFTPLAKLTRIEQLQFSYVKLTDANVEKITKLPVRVQLGLMGTDLSVEAVAKIRNAMPGLKIEHKFGGFLGVKCNSFSHSCQIENLVKDGAAAESGLEPGDVIEVINRVAIASFEDLQVEIGSHVAGDEIEIDYNRRGEKLNVKLKLKPMKTEVIWLGQ